jgi:peptide/nickel transport system substrate-binding protein
MRLAAVIVALLLAVVAGPAQGASRLTLGLQLEPTTLDPTASPAGAVRDVAFRTVFEGLVRLEAGGRVAPLLAERWTVSPDGLSWTFQLRRGVVFHDGTPFDALAVKAALDRARAPRSTNGQRSQFARIDHVDAPDPDHVRIVLKSRYSGLAGLLGLGDAVIPSPASVSTAGMHPVGTGPFRFSSWRRGDSVTLVRNPAYWGRPPALDEVRFRFISDPAAATAALAAGDIDGFPAFPAPEALSRFRSDPRFVVHTGGSEAKTLLALNNRRGPFAQLKVRQALTAAIDRRAVIAAAMFGYGRPIGSHFPPDDAGYVDLTDAHPHDPALARRLLAEAGYPHGFDTVIALPPLPYARRGGEVIAAQLAEVGVRARLENVEWAQWLDRVFARADYDMTIVAHVEPMDLGIYARDDYYFGYRSPAYRALIQRLDAAADEPQRLAVLGEAQRRLADDAVNVWLFEYPALGVFRREVRDIWAPTPVGALDLSAARIEGASLGNATGDGGGGGGAGLAAGLFGVALAVLGWRAARQAGPAWLAWRVGGMLLTLVAASIVVFVLLQVAPGDPARFMMGLNAEPQALDALRRELGLDAPAPARFLGWLGGVLRGDLGISYTYRAPVARLVAERLAVTLPLTLLALTLSCGLALIAALASARRPGSWIDRAVGLICVVGVAVPGFWLGLLLVLAFAVTLHWAPAGGFPGWSSGIGPALGALILPALALAGPQAAILARVLRAALIEALAQDYMRTARARGLSETAALLRHALPNALSPALTLVGLQFGFLLAGAAIVEGVFALPGLGRLLFQAVAQRDLIVVQGVVLLLVFAVTLSSLVVDLLAAALDPRIGDAR